jgi:hypothetical protein
MISTPINSTLCECESSAGEFCVLGYSPPHAVPWLSEISWQTAAVQPARAIRCACPTQHIYKTRESHLAVLQLQCDSSHSRMPHLHWATGKLQTTCLPSSCGIGKTRDPSECNMSTATSHCSCSSVKCPGWSVGWMMVARRLGMIDLKRRPRMLSLSTTPHLREHEELDWHRWRFARCGKKTSWNAH